MWSGASAVYQGARAPPRGWAPDTLRLCISGCLSMSLLTLRFVKSKWCCHVWFPCAVTGPPLARWLFGNFGQDFSEEILQMLQEYVESEMDEAGQVLELLLLGAVKSVPRINTLCATFGGTPQLAFRPVALSVHVLWCWHLHTEPQAEHGRQSMQSSPLGEWRLCAWSAQSWWSAPSWPKTSLLIGLSTRLRKRCFSCSW